MKDAYEQNTLPGVPRAKQGREVAPQWAWTEASVWTERMLATLERGIKGDKWYSLIDINRSLRGWLKYFQHSHWTTFKPLDQWIRQRLRSILRKRHKLSGRARGRDHQRWPNDFFAIRGLISLALAHVQAANAAKAR